MTSEERRQLIIEHGSDICEFCKRNFPYAEHCRSTTCRCAEDSYFEQYLKDLPHP